MRNVVVVQRAGDVQQLTHNDLLRLYRTSHHIRAIHQLLAGAANRLQWRVLGLGGQPLPAATEVLDSTAGELFADYYVLGQCFLLPSYARSTPLQPDPSALQIINPEAPLLSAASLVTKLEELERAERQAYYRLGANMFIMPASEVVTLSEREALAELLTEQRRAAGLGAISVLPLRAEVLELKEKIADHQLPELKLAILRELCNLFAIDSSLLNDPENKTYSNKTEAQKALFVNVIIPYAAKFAHVLNTALRAAGNFTATITYDASSIESIAEHKQQQAQFVLQLLASGVISIEEARKMLEL